MQHFEESLIKFETEINVNYTQTLSPYRAVNTILLCYKNQPVNVV